MGLFDKVTASIEADKKMQLEELLLQGEELKKFVMGMGDFVAVTDKRIIMLDQDFNWGEMKQAIVSIKPETVTAVSMVNPTVGTIRKFKVAVFAGGVKAEATFGNKEACTECYKILNTLIF